MIYLPSRLYRIKRVRIEIEVDVSGKGLEIDTGYGGFQIETAIEVRMRRKRPAGGGGINNYTGREKKRLEEGEEGRRLDKKAEGRRERGSLLKLEKTGRKTARPLSGVIYYLSTADWWPLSQP